MWLNLNLCDVSAIIHYLHSHVDVEECGTSALVQTHR